jgi:hypothetical protein
VSLAADGSPCAPGVNEPGTSLEPEQSLRPAAVEPPFARTGILQHSPAAPTFVGIDVAKDQLDVHLRPAGESFALGRDGADLDALVERLDALAPALVVLQATEGFEITVAGALAVAGLPLVWSTPGTSGISLGPPGAWPRPITWMQRRSRALPATGAARSRTRPPGTTFWRVSVYAPKNSVPTARAQQGEGSGKVPTRVKRGRAANPRGARPKLQLASHVAACAPVGGWCLRTGKSRS